MTDPRILTDALGGSALSRAVQAGALSGGLLPAMPATADGWRQRARAIAADAGARGGWLEALRGAFGPAGPALARLERVAAAGGVVVTTGQQAGLFGGPVYTWSKALGALALADAIERETGVPAAPVFWAATDDADYAEANHTRVVVHGALQLLETHAEPAAGTPMTITPLGDVDGALASLREACGSMAYPPAYAAVAAAYGDAPTVGDAYVRLLRALLDGLGIAVLDSSHAAVRAAGGGVLRGALAHGAAVDAALAERQTWLESHGYEPQVAHVAGLTTVFVHERGIKRRVPVDEAAAMARDAAPDSLSPNVLLRPVMERAILPTVAYLAGPGELAYFAQVSAVAEAVGAAQPLAVPRWSCTIVEPAVDRALARLGIGLDALQDAEALEGRVARGSIPDDVRDALAALRAATRDGLAALGARDAAADGGALLKPEVVQGTERQIAFRLDRLERRLAAAAKRRGSDALRDVRLARAFVWPEGQRQERTLNFIPFLARHGEALWTGMRAAADRHATALVTGGGRGGHGGAAGGR